MTLHPSNATVELLRIAYERPCFICKQQGACKHREPAVELALLRAAARTPAEIALPMTRRAAA